MGSIGGKFQTQTSVIIVLCSIEFKEAVVPIYVVLPSCALDEKGVPHLPKS